MKMVKSARKINPLFLVSFLLAGLTLGFTAVNAAAAALPTSPLTATPDPFPTCTPPPIVEVPKDYPSIQAAIDAALDTDTIIVSPGTYHESIDFKGKAITVTSTNPDDPAVVEATIIEPVNLEETAVYFKSGEGNDSVLAGFTIQNGIRGIHCSSSSPTLENNIIQNNKATYESEQASAAGIYCAYSSSRIIGNIIRNNYAECGGAGIFLIYSHSPLIEKNIIEGNTADHGAGIDCFQSSPLLENNIIRNNRAIGGKDNDFRSGQGGGMRFCDSLPNAIGNIIQNNRAQTEGAGLYLIDSSTIRFENNIIKGNEVDGGCGGVSLVRSDVLLLNNTIVDNQSFGISCENSSSTIINSLIWNNGNGIDYLPSDIAPVVNYSDVQGGWWGLGNIDADPLFDGTGYKLTKDSPCVDAGTSDGAPELDFEGETRPHGASVDIGADEFTPRYSISGYVRDSSGQAMRGVKLALSGGVSQSVSTDDGGYYEFASLPAGKDYKGTPSLDCWNFSPASRTYPGLTKNMYNQNYIGEPLKYSIGGYVKNQLGLPIRGVKVTLSGGASRTASTDCRGYYVFSSLPAGLNYQVTPSKTGWKFQPMSYSYIPLTQNKSNQNFTGSIR